ncbi:protein FAM186A [Peromyscus californicus insignis]|uniref:protein FAM186A n=1 Tax=Peromyscus californicus insignis TaxID=564181 RepID=UPI0022A760BD|nr:protein FAM186A [Peromyscus californicus insignis]
MSKVELIMTRYAIDSTSPGKRGSISESQRKKRKVFLEKIAAHIKSIDIREKILTKLLSWLEDWNFVLSEVAEIDVDEYHHWIAQMELLPEMLKEMDSSIKTVCQVTTLLLEEKKRQKKKLVTRGTLWKAWKERVVKRPAAAHALRPDQMIFDQLALNTKVTEIQDMLQELISSAMLSKLENNAIKYISATILNLSKALSTVSDELKLMTLQVTNVGVSEEKETEKDFLQRVIQELSKENEMLHQKLRDSEEKCDQLIRIKNFLGRQLLVPTTPSLRMLAVGSPQAPVSKDVDAGEIDSLLNKELEKIIDESQTKGVRATAIKWDSSMTYVAQGEMATDVAQQQAEEKADQDQKKQYPPVPLPAETSDTNLEKEEKKAVEVASSQFSDLQALDMKRKDRKSLLEGKPQGQEVKSGASSLWERFKKGRSEHSLGKSPASSEVKIVPPVKPMDKESKTEVEQTKASQPESTPEPPKIEMKGKRPVPGKTEETPGTTKQQQSKLQPRTPKQTPATPDARSEQNTLESFQKAILAFLREKTNNVGRAFDPKSIQEEEKSLERADVEKLYLIKAKTEEYVQKVAETVTRTLRAYKEARKKQLREKFSRQQRTTAALPQPFARQGLVSTKSDLISFLLSEMSDPVIRALTQTIIDELELEKDGVTVSAAGQDHRDKRREWQRWEEETWKEEQRLPKQAGPQHRAREKAAELEELRPAAAAVTPDVSRAQDLREREDTDKEKLKVVRDAEEGLRPKGSKPKLPGKSDSKSKDLFKTFTQSAMVLTPRWMKSLKLQTSQVQLFQVDPRAMESPDEKQPFSPRTLLVSAKPLPVPVPEQAQIVDSKMSPISRVSFTPEWVQVWGGPPSHEPMKEVQIPPPTAKQEQELGTQLMAPRILQRTMAPGGSFISEIPQTAEQGPISGVTVTQRAVLPLQQIQGKDITLTLKQALDQGIAPTPEPAKEPRITLTPQQAQALGIILTPEQAKAQTISLTPQQAQALALTLTPEQTKEQEISLTPPQAQGLGITLTSEQAQALGLTLTPEQTKAQRVSLSPQQAQVLGVSLTPQQAQAQRINLTPEQAQALGIDITPQLVQAQTSIFTSQLTQAQQITITPEEAKDLGIALTPQQVKVQGISLTPEQGRALGMALTPDQAQAQGIILTPQQAQALGLTLTPQQVKTQRVCLSPEQAQALGITITSEQAQALGIAITPQLAQAQQITITPEEAEDLGIALTPQQVKVQGISLTPEQGWALGMALTPDQAQAQGIILTPQQAQALGLTLTPQQVKTQRVCLSPEQAQALGITITPEQAQALGIDITPQLAQTQQITITPEEAKNLGIALTPQQVKVQGISLTPEQGRALGMALTPEQAQAQGIILTPQQAQALGLTLTPQQVKTQRVCLSPEQAQALGITITSEQAQALGIAITPQLAQTQQITITPEEAKNLGIALTPQQVKVQGISLTPEQGRALGMALTPEQAQAQGIILTPQQAQALGLTLTPQQVKTQRVCLSPEQAQALGITITPEQAQALGIDITPQLAQAQQITITPEEAEDLGIALTPQQVKVQGISLTPEQGRALGMALTPEQAQAQGIILTPQQAQALGLTLTPQQVKTQRVCLSPEQAQALMITITSEQAQALGIAITPQLAQAQTSIFTPQLAQTQQITITSEEAEDLGIALTPQQVKVQGISLTPQQGQALGMALTPDQAKAQGIILTPQQAQALGLTLTPQQIKTQRVRLTPERAQALGIAITSEQAQALGITLIPKLAQPQEISLSPEEAQALGLTLTPQQAQIQKIFLTPKQAQALGITLTPEQAKALKISLTPQQAQVLGITLTLEQAKAHRISLTTEQAQVLGITLSLQQARALGIAPTLKQTAASGITLTPEPGKEKEVSLTRVQALALEISPTPEQTHTLGISLSPQQARDLGLTLTSRQAKVQKICLTPEQAQALGVTFTPEQAKGWRISLTPEQAQALGITLTPAQAKAHRISVTPEQAEALGITLTPGQAQALGIRLTPSRFQTWGISSPKKFQDLEAPLTYEQAAALRGRPTTEQIQTLKVPITPESMQTPKPAVASKQTQTIEIPLTPQLSPAFGIPLLQGQGKALGMTLMPGQTQAFQQIRALQPPLPSRQARLLGQFGPGEIQTLTFTIALEKAQNLGVTFTQEQTQAASITLTSEQVAALEDALTEELAWTWGLLTASEKPAVLVPPPDRLLPTSIALQKLKSSPQAPFSPRTSLAMSFLPDSEKLEETCISPTYRQILADRGQVTPTQLLTPEVPSIPGLPLGHWHSFKPGDTGSSLTPETHLTHRRLTPPLISGVPPTSGEIPGLFVPGGSAVPFQPPAIHDQAPYMQIYSAPGQPKPSLIIPEQGFSVRTPVSAEAFPVPGRPQRISPSSASQKKPVTVSPPKPESIRAHPSAALGFEVSPAPFPMEKIQMSKFSDILEETRVLQDSPDMRSLGMFQPYVTSSRIPGSKSHHIGERAPSARGKSIASLPSLTTQLSQASQITPSDRGQRPRLPPIDEPWILSPVPGTGKARRVGSPLTAQHHEDRYFVDVEAQRKNLAILNHAAQTAGLPSQYHTIARNLIIELLHMNTVRLGYLSRKYVAYRLIQLARNNIIKRLRAIQNTGKGYETQNLFTMLDRIDHYQKKVMWFWTEKQNQLEQRRKHCLWSMMQFFTQLERVFKLNLSQPVPLLSDFKQIPDLPKFQRPVLELLIEDKKPNIFKTLGEQAQMEAIWNADLSTSSYPITEKTSLSTLWAQLGGYPDIPRLLELDIQSTFRKSLASIRSQSKKIPK